MTIVDSAKKNTTGMQADAIRQAMGQYAFWKILPISGSRFDITKIKDKNFDLKSELMDEKMYIRLYGKLDAVTAPRLLGFFEKIFGENIVKQVEVDCNALDIVSSEGLRALLLMMKQCVMGLTIRNVNDTIKDIMVQTGYDALLTVEN